MSPNLNLAAQAVYLLCNMASGNEKQKTLIMESNIIKPLVDLLVIRLMIIIQ